MDFTSTKTPTRQGGERGVQKSLFYKWDSNADNLLEPYLLALALFDSRQSFFSYFYFSVPICSMIYLEKRIHDVPRLKKFFFCSPLIEDIKKVFSCPIRTYSERETEKLSLAIQSNNNNKAISNL